MKKISTKLSLLALVMAVLLSACGGSIAAPAQSTTGKAQAALVQFTGIIEAMDGDQWTVNGKVFTVDPASMRDGPFNIGDTIKVEVEVQSDGSVLVKRVERADDGNSNDDDDDSNLNGNDNDNANSNLNDNGNSNDASNGNSNFNQNNNDDDNDDDGGNDNDDDDEDDDNDGDDD